MFLFAIISLVGGFVSFFLGAYILLQNPQGRLNILFMGICITLGVIGVSEFGMRSSDNFESALIWTRVADIFPLTIALLLHFSFEFSKMTKKWNRYVIYSIIYIPSIILTILALTIGYLGVVPIKEPWGWSYGQRIEPLFTIYVVWSIICATISLILVMYVYLNPPDTYTKYQSKFIILGILSTFMFYLIFDYILSELFRLDLPDMGTSSYILCSILIAHAIIKYKLFKLGLRFFSQEILYNISDILILVDKNTIIKEVNQAVLNISGYTKEELYGKKFETFLKLKEDIRIFQTTHEDLLRSQNKITYNNLELNFKTKSGETIPILLSSSKITNTFGEIVGIVNIGRNITEKKQVEEERRNKIQEQKRFIDEILRRSRIKTNFMSNISHELRTPLNSIIGFSDLLLEKSYGELNSDQKEFLNDIQSSSKHLLELINQMLDLSKIEAGKLKLHLKRIKLASLIPQIHSTIKSLYKKKGLTFQINGLNKNQTIKADPIRIKEIFYNLLSNAIKYTEKGQIVLNIRENEQFFYFDVIDTGIGIAKDHYHLIFEEFKTIEQPEITSIKGVGLGLPLTKRLIGLLGGTISFESELGVGTTFTFSVPK
ncbi:MAG: putative Histidine kinase [Promethearchaeota archaeon]|nr:MAG: putative Histidine kinase [Candidatus Lokiarchaeota archaeon]